MNIKPVFEVQKIFGTDLVIIGNGHYVNGGENKITSNLLIAIAENPDLRRMLEGSLKAMKEYEQSVQD